MLIKLNNLTEDLEMLIKLNSLTEYLEMLFLVVNISEVSLQIGRDGETSRAQMAGVGLLACVSPAKKFFFIFIFILFIIFFNLNMLFINEEFIIVSSLIFFFSISLSQLRLIITKYFLSKIQSIFFYFSYLIHLELLLCDKIFILLSLEELKFLYLNILEYIFNFISYSNIYFRDSLYLNRFLIHLRSLFLLNKMCIINIRSYERLSKDLFILLKVYANLKKLF